MNVSTNIRDLNMMIFKEITNRHKEFGFDITPIQALIIMAVKDRGELCQKEIEQFVTCNKSTLSSVLDTMEKNGLINRVEDKNDSRKKNIVLTNKSIEMSKVLEHDNNYIEELLLKGLSQDETIHFIDITNKMMKNLERE